MKTAILHNTFENHDIEDQDTMIQISELEAALSGLDIENTKIDFTADLSTVAKQLLQYEPTLVFNCVENIWGKEQTNYLPPMLLDSLTIPYTGANATAILVTTHKTLAKQRMLRLALPTPPWRESTSFQVQDLEQFQGLYIIKPISEDASRGITQDAVVSNSSELFNFLQTDPTSMSTNWFAERYIEGREFNISLISQQGVPTVLPIAELIFANTGQIPICDYSTKWDPNSPGYSNTTRRFEFADEDYSLLQRLEHLALECWHAFKLTNYARVDFRVDSNGDIWILEVNANPALTKDAGFMAAATHAKLHYEDVILKLIEDVLYRFELSR